MQTPRSGQNDDARPTLWMLTTGATQFLPAMVGRLVPEVRLVATDSLDELVAALAGAPKSGVLAAVEGTRWVQFAERHAQLGPRASRAVGVFSTYDASTRVTYGIPDAIPVLLSSPSLRATTPRFVAALLAHDRRQKALVTTLRRRARDEWKRGAPERAAMALAARRQRERLVRMRRRTGERPLSLTPAQGAWLRPRVAAALEEALQSGGRDRAIALRRIRRALAFDPVVLDGRLGPLVASLIVVPYGTSPLAANEIARALTEHGYPTSHWRGLLEPE